MDRRQRKTRQAIFEAFINLLSQKEFNRITVGEIIERADIGRATFYAHFETKDFLLKSLCKELFCHIFDAERQNHKHKHIFECDCSDSVFLHLLKHLEHNDNHIAELLSSENNDLFLNYFKSELTILIKNSSQNLLSFKPECVSDEFYINHISATFVQTVYWWSKEKFKLPAEEIYKYFLSVLNISI